MSEITELTFVGDWSIFVYFFAYNQRVLIRNTELGDEYVLDAATYSAPVHVYGRGQEPWELHIQHNDAVHGWKDNWLQPEERIIAGTILRQTIKSEDDTSPTSNRDFNALSVRADKLGMLDQTIRPFAVMPSTMQVTPDGIFETALGRFFMAVKVRNIWTETWPNDTTVGLSQPCSRIKINRTFIFLKPKYKASTSNSDELKVTLNKVIT